MRTLVEGLFDDDFGETFDRELLENWLKENAEGTFKSQYLAKKRYTKIWGDVVIRNVAAIPPINVGEINGSVHIVNCGITSLAGIFYEHCRCNGSISITGCKNLTDISQLPYIIDGSLEIVNCPSLRSLDGENGFAGDISIMKCGKRFTQAQISKRFTCSGRVYCSMDDEIPNLNEAFQDAILTRMYDQLIKRKIKITNFQGTLGNAFNLAKLSSANRTTFKMPQELDKAKKAVNKFSNYKGTGFAITETFDGEFKNLFTSGLEVWDLTEDKGKGYGAHQSTSCRPSEFMEYFDPSTYEGGFALANVQYIHVYRPVLGKDGKDSDWTELNKLHTQRRDAKQGIVSNDPRYLEQLIRDNRERYKNEVKKLRALRGSQQYMGVANRVQKIMDRFNKIITKMVQDPSWSDKNRYTIDSLFLKIRNGYNSNSRFQDYGLLYVFRRWVETLTNEALGRGSYNDSASQQKELEDICVRCESFLQQLGL
jgi:hypothetical protein